VDLIRWLGKLTGGEGKLPTADRALFDIVFLRLAIGIPNELSPDSLTAATIAATLLAAFEETLLRRVTLLFVIRDPEDTEWEWFREWDCRGREPEFVDMDKRCWLRGLEECWISYVGTRSALSYIYLTLDNLPSKKP
jgi:hypothetical protein